MKTLKLIAALLLVTFAAGTATAQVTKRDGDKDNKKKKDDAGVVITDRQQAFYEVKKPSDADLQWMKVIYRQLDLTVGKNPALYYPEEPNEDGQSLFFIIMRLLANNQITAYEYLDGREMFTDEYKIKVDEMLDRFHIMFTEAKGSTEKNPKFEIEDADIPGNEILSYYIIERWEFDTRSNQMKTRVEALCPVLHRTDEFGGEPIKYPMFWVMLNDIRPYMANQYVFTDDDNNLSRYSLDDFFKLGMYTGEIYKTKNLRNLALRQMFPEDEQYKQAQDSIENRLMAFNKDLWVPDREEIQARARAARLAKAEAEGEAVTDDEQADGEKEELTTKRGKETKEKLKEEQKKEEKKKARRAKIKSRTSGKSSGGGATRSVRNRKK
ncbi:MAG: gliding motility protein GldN [Muribaculaceae bacterium]|nr:gliding motility protein GldN [Muribaculaceae bacterium]